MFPYKAKLFFMEVMSVLFTPVVLCFSLPHCAPDVLEFIRDHTAYIDGVGAVCDYCTFDLDKYGDEDFGTVPEVGHLEVNQRPVHGKMEQSFLNFQQEHPDWQGGGTTGREMINRLRIFRAQKEMERDELLSTALQNSMHMSLNPQQRVMSATPSRVPRDVSDTSSVINPEQGSSPSQQQAAAGLQITRETVAPLRGCAPRSPTRRVAPQEYTTDFFRGMGSVRRVGRQPSSGNVFAGGAASSTALMSSGLGQSYSSGVGGGGMPSILRSILKRENIDYENDFYWLSKVSRGLYTII